jgi:hypothetical protein
VLEVEKDVLDDGECEQERVGRRVDEDEIVLDTDCVGVTIPE